MLLRLPLLTKRICSTTAPRAFPIQLSPHRMSSSSAPNTTPADQLAAGGETDHGLASQMQPQRLQLVKDILDLFSAKPTVENLEKNWAKDGVFEDPIAIANGYREFSSQWFGMPKAFSKSETIAWKVTKDEPTLIEYEQLQRYTLALVGTVKDMRSLVHVQLNSEGKITRLEDRWDNKPLPQGAIAKTFRGLNGHYVTPTLVSVPKTDAEKK